MHPAVLALPNTALRDSLDLNNGSLVYLKLRRITRFSAAANAPAGTDRADPAAMV